MLIKVQHTELVAASPEQLFAVLTDYANYPRSNANVISATVVHRDDHTAEVEAKRTTLIEPKVRFTDIYAPKPLLQFSRRYASNASAQSLWTVEPAYNGQSYFTITAEMTLPFFPGIFMRPLLKRMFYQGPRKTTAFRHGDTSGLAALDKNECSMLHSVGESHLKSWPRRASASPWPTTPSPASPTGNVRRIWRMRSRLRNCTVCSTDMRRCAARYSTCSVRPTTGA